MSGLQFQAPLNLLWGLLAIPIILLYMLRLRRQEKLVSSTYLWQRFLQDREANAFWQRLKANWLLFLQLLILAVLTLALARPYFPSSIVAGGDIIILLDASASMQATDIAPNRFAQAKEEAQEIIDNAARGDKITLIKAGASPEILATAAADRAQLRQALQDAQPEYGTTDWKTAITLANGLASNFPDAQIVIISDGGLPPNLPQVSKDVHFLPVGSDGENLAITALSIRDGLQGPIMFTSVQNFGSELQETLLSIKVDDQLYDARQIRLDGGEHAAYTWQLPTNAAVVEAGLASNPGDQLPIDDQAWAVRPVKAGRKALLITEGNLFLEQVFRVMPGIEAFKSPIDGEITAEDYDLLIFDNALPSSSDPGVNMLLINPPQVETSPIIQVTGAFTNTQKTRQVDSPLLKYVDWKNVHIQKASLVDVPWAAPIVEGVGGPLLWGGEYAGGRVVILPFDLRTSDLPLQIAFPILMANITNWLRPNGSIEIINHDTPKQPVHINPPIGTNSVNITSPTDALWQSEVDGGPLVYLNTSYPGIYQVSFMGSGNQLPTEYMAVNSFSAIESNIQPQQVVKIGLSDIKSAEEKDIGQKEIWPWLMMMALMVLLSEWWLHFKGWRLPGIRLS